MRFILSLALFVYSSSLFAATCNLQVSGKLIVNPLQEKSSLGWDQYFSKQEPLANVEVRLSGGKKNRAITKWQETTTDSAGRFNFEVEEEGKDCEKDYKLRVKVKFASSTINVKKSRNRTPDWYKVYQSPKADVSFSGHVDLGKVVFRQSGKWDRGSEVARQHAMIWLVYQRLNQYLGSLSPDDSELNHTFINKFEIKYPNNKKIIRDAKNGLTHELSYANPINKTISIIKNDRMNDLKVSVLVHEMMHIWQYERMKSIDYPSNRSIGNWALNKTRGQPGMARYLIGNRDMHDSVDKEYVAFQEGFSWWFEEIAAERIFSSEVPTVLNRGRLTREVAASLETMDNHDVGWRQILTVLTLREPLAYIYGDATTEGKNAALIEGKALSIKKRRCESSTVSVATILALSSNHISDTTDDSLEEEMEEGLGPLVRSQMTLEGYFQRADFLALNVGIGLDQEITDKYKRLIDPANDEEYMQIFCDV
tara:strand:- start:9568 stop:11010 length:1443 start_codon:yes stop_codon:yes gene_type:complete